jgi:hypothetical protein
MSQGSVERSGCGWDGHPRHTEAIPHRALSTVSFNPTARVTATSVESRGFPFADKARYKLSRSIPAALATLAIPPRASAMRRNAIKSTPGSSLSSSAAFKYSAAKLWLSRRRRRITSSCDSLVLFFTECVSFPDNRLSIRGPAEYRPTARAYLLHRAIAHSSCQSWRSKFGSPARRRFAIQAILHQAISSLPDFHFAGVRFA